MFDDSVTETPITLAETGLVFGIHTRPAVCDRSAAFIFLNSGLIHRVGPFRLYVDLARRLGSFGFHVLRIDQSGKGDSARRNAPHSEARVQDIAEAVLYLSQFGIGKVVVIGLCSGADDPFWAAQDIPEVAGIVMLDGFCAITATYRRNVILRKIKAALSLRKWKKKLREISSPRSLGVGDEVNLRDWPDPALGRQMYLALLGRGVRLLCIFTHGATDYYNYVGQLAEFLGTEDYSETLTEVLFSSAAHTYPLVNDRELMMQTVCSWATEVFPETGAGF